MWLWWAHSQGRCARGATWCPALPVAMCNRHVEMLPGAPSAHTCTLLEVRMRKITDVSMTTPAWANVASVT
jgi:hypothetical protein